MRLLTYRADGGLHIGLLREDEVVEIDGDMLALIDSGDAGLETARKAASSAGARTHRLDAIRVVSPIPTPRGNVVAIGRNYQAHAEEGAAGKTPEPPTVFTKALTTVAGPYDDIVIDPQVSSQVDWEVELGVIIGATAKNTKRADALRHVFGYVALNDVSARDIQFGWGGQFFKGKSIDGYCPMGPWIVTPDEIDDPQRLRLRLRVNGVTKQDGNTKEMIYPVDALIEWVSKGMTLLPGTIVATGTPDGVGVFRKPPEFLNPGDVMETEVEKIGKLENRVVTAGRD